MKSEVREISNGTSPWFTCILKILSKNIWLQF